MMNCSGGMRKPNCRSTTTAIHNFLSISLHNLRTKWIIFPFLAVSNGDDILMSFHQNGFSTRCAAQKCHNIRPARSDLVQMDLEPIIPKKLRHERRHAGLVGTRNLDELHGAEFTIGPDYLEVGSYIGAAVVTRGEILIRNAGNRYLDMVRSVYGRLGVSWETIGNDILVSEKYFGRFKMSSVNILP